MPIMHGYLIAFRLPKGIQNKVYTRFQKRFYGQETSSHRGKYRYRRSGFLENVSHRKLIRGVIIVKVEDKNKVIEFLQEYNVEIHIRKIVLLKSDIDVLMRDIE